jgi:hypothetical protein
MVGVFRSERAIVPFCDDQTSKKARSEQKKEKETHDRTKEKGTATTFVTGGQKLTL